MISHSNLKTNLIKHVCRISLLIIAKLKKPILKYIFQNVILILIYKNKSKIIRTRLY